MPHETHEKTFEVELPAALKVTNIRGTVTIDSHDQEVIEVTAIKHLKKNNNGQTEIVIEQEADGTVSARTIIPEQKKMFGFKSFKSCKVDYQIKVPRACSVDVSVVSSDASVRAIDGALNLSTVSGDGMLEDINGEFHISTVSGDLKADHLEGSGKLSSVSGDVRLTGSEIPTMKTSTVSGDILVDTPLGEGPYKFTSVSGDVSLVVPDDSSCTVRFNTLSGSAHINLGSMTEVHRRGQRTLTIGEDGPVIQLSSTSGDLRVASTEHGLKARLTPIKEIEVEAAEAPITQMEILEQLDRGELSVDDALEKLV